MAIRSGLARLEGVESINPRADFKAATCQVHWKNGQFIDPQTLSNHVDREESFSIEVSARLCARRGPLANRRARLVRKAEEGSVDDLVFVDERSPG